MRPQLDCKLGDTVEVPFLDQLIRGKIIELDLHPFGDNFAKIQAE